MITEQIRNSLRQADFELMHAEAELNRPHEDVVTLSACQSVRNSMKQMMRLYLLAHAIDNDGKMSLEELKGACEKANRLFSEVDIANIECKGLGHENCDGKYCLDIENVSCCVAAANKLKEVIWSELMVKK